MQTVVLDEISEKLDNEVPPLIQDEEDMPLNEADRAWIRETIREALQGRGFGAFIRRWSGTGAAVAILILVLTQWTSYIEFRTTTIETLKRLEGQLAKQTVVSQATSPPETFRAALPDLGNALATVRLQKLVVPPDVMDSLQHRLVTEGDRSPAYWAVVAELISSRKDLAPASIPPDLAAVTGSAMKNKGDCFSEKITPHAPATGPLGPEIITMHDCTLALDDLNGFNLIPVAMRNRLVPGAAVLMNLVRVRITYHGGEIIPVNQIMAYDCSFDFSIDKSPTVRGQRLLEAFLSEDLSSPNPQIPLPS